MVKHHQTQLLDDDVENPDEPKEPEEPEKQDEAAPKDLPTQITVQFDTNPVGGVWQPHDVWGRLAGFGGEGLTYLEGAPPE